MPKPLRILCVQGVGDHRDDSAGQEAWETAIRDGIARWNPQHEVPQHEVDVRFVDYHQLFANASLNAGDTLHALRLLLGSGIYHAVGDWLSDWATRSRRRGIFDFPDRIRWTAGMVVQWVDNDELRKEARQCVIEDIESFQPHVIAAHSLGSLICYDAFVNGPGKELVRDKTFISFGSQIGNPFVRGGFGGRLVPLDVKMWYHLYNRHDDIFTAELEFTEPNFQQVPAHNELEGLAEHRAVVYLSHPNVVDRVWKRVARRGTPRNLATSDKAFAKLARAAKRRALLVGINDYPQEADRLDGCVNDVFLVSSMLQESGFAAEDIRIVLNRRATADAIRRRIEWLLDGVGDEDQRVFYYSGHGAQISSYGIGETVDRLDECLVPYDFDWTEQRAIIDDELYDLYSQLPYDARLVMILDCCHSGGMTRDGGARIRGLSPPDDIRHRQMSWSPKDQMWVQRTFPQPNITLAEQPRGADYVGRSGSKRRLGRAVGLRTLPNARYDAVRKAMGHRGPYLPMIYQACQEDQYAYEYRHGVTSYGAFTYTMAEILRQHRRDEQTLTFDALLKATAKRLRDLQYDQTPILVGPKALCKGPIPW